MGGNRTWPRLAAIPLATVLLASFSACAPGAGREPVNSGRENENSSQTQGGARAITQSASTPGSEALISGFEAKFDIRVAAEGITQSDFDAYGPARRLYGSAEGMRLNLMRVLDDGFCALPEKLTRFSQTAVPIGITLQVLDESGDDAIDGSFDTRGRMLYLYYAAQASTVVHEYAHLLTYELMSLYGGEQALKNRWMPLNNGVAYGGDYYALSARERATFYTDYALTDMYEDIAETAVMVFSPTQAHASEALLAKAALLLEMLDELTAANPAAITLNPANYVDGGVGDGHEYGAAA